MADTKITGLTEDTALVLTDLVPVVVDVSTTPASRKATLATLMKLAVSNVAIQVLTAGTTTYTPTTGMKKVLIVCQGGGGGSPAATGADESVGGGGGGGCAIRLYTAAEIGADEACVVGAASSGAGNDSTFSAGGTLITGSGGAVGVATGNSSTTGITGAGGAGGAATGGDLNIPGEYGDPGVTYSTTLKQGGKGGNSFLGHGGKGGLTASTFENGAAGSGYGSGAGGGITHDNTDLTAQNGAAGIIWAIEFLEGV